MKVKRRLYSLVPASLLILLLTLLDHRTLIFLPLLLMGLQWYFMGVLFMVALGSFLIYTKTGGLYGLGLMALALLSVEMGYLDRERAPPGHYLILIASVSLAFPTYLLMASLSPALPRLEVTALAAVLLLVMYAFTRLATS